MYTDKSMISQVIVQKELLVQIFGGSKTNLQMDDGITVNCSWTIF